MYPDSSFVLTCYNEADGHHGGEGDAEGPLVDSAGGGEKALECLLGIDTKWGEV